MKNFFKNESVIDSFFGEVEVTFDKFTNSFFLGKEIELAGIRNLVSLYIETDNKESSQDQQLAFKKISEHFSKIWQSIKVFLVTTKNLINEESLMNNYRIDSITLPKKLNFNSEEWELELLNLEDGFSKIVVEMDGIHPVHFSVEG